MSSSWALEPDPLSPIEQTPSLSVLEPDFDPSLVGQPVLRVEAQLSGARWGKPVALSSVPVGAPFSPELVRRAMRELSEREGTAAMTSTARVEGGGVVVSIVAEPSRIVDAVQLTGSPFDRASVLSAAGIGLGDEITEVDLDRISQRLRTWLVRRGHPRATVEIEAVELDEPREVLLAITVEPGPEQLVTQRVFVIDPTEDARVGSKKFDYSVVSGDRVDEEALDEADRRLGESLRASGFPTARVRHIALARDENTYLYVYVESGPELILRFEGAVAFDEDQLLSIARGAAGTSEPLTSELAAERVRKAYVERGYLDAVVTNERLASSTPGVEAIRVRVREGERVVVARRTYPCLDVAEAAVETAQIDEVFERALAESMPSDPLFSAPDPAIVDDALGGRSSASPHPGPASLVPARSFAPEAYARASERVRDFLRAKGYLHATVGPFRVERAACSDASPPNRCIELPLPDEGVACSVDERGLPLERELTSERWRCVPDLDAGKHCSARIELRLPVQLGPRTLLWDAAIDGNSALSDAQLLERAGLRFGEALDLDAIERARTELIGEYHDLGYAYADLRAQIEPSADHTRARLRLTVTENERVFIDGIDVEGALRTDPDLVRSRLALAPGDVYSKRAVRASEEQVASLGTFSSVSVSLVDPEVPQRRKRLVVRVTEYPAQYIEPRVGFSTGDGLRFGFEYGHRNIGSLAIGLILRVQLSYLFDFMILDSAVAENLRTLPVSQRLERRDSIKFVFPDVGLGPRVNLAVEALDVRDNQRDFGLTRQAIVPSLNYRPRRDLLATFSVSGELNDEQIFNADAVANTIRNNPGLSLLLLFPDGTTVAAAQRIALSWDRRDPPLEARRGTFASVDVEHVNALPVGDSTASTASLVSHFLRMNGRVAGYVPITDGGVSLALSVGAGLNVQLASDSKTYPDRLFFLGGFDSIRSFLVNSVVPQDVADKIPSELRIEDVAIRGGDLSFNPRAELRLPVNDVASFGLFVDAANLWVDPASFEPYRLRYAGGAGVRVATPVGPLALDYGINLNRRPWEDFGALHFSVGLY
jgi:outer membrane protein insertion porin family